MFELYKVETNTQIKQKRTDKRIELEWKYILCVCVLEQDILTSDVFAANGKVKLNDLRNEHTMFIEHHFSVNRIAKMCLCVRLEVKVRKNKSKQMSVSMEQSKVTTHTHTHTKS